MSETREEKRSVFHRIAPVYGLFYHRQIKMFNKVLDIVRNELDLSIYDSILDVGCGTGALCSVLDQRGFSVTGVDPVPVMLEVGRRRPENGHITFLQADAVAGLPFGDNCFDLVIASYVAHGLTGEERVDLYAEMGRIARHLVVVYDYNGNRSIPTSAIEYLEGGDYFTFIRQVRDELRRQFGNLRILDVGKRAAWYVCTPS